LLCVVIDISIFKNFEEDKTLAIHTFRRIVWYGARAITMTIISVYIGNLIYTNKKQQQLKNDLNKLEIENYENKFKMLKSHVNPHFLFNTINTLNALIKKDPVTAHRFIDKLSDFLNYTTIDNDISTVEDELKIAKSYAYLTYLRYGKALKFDFEIDNSILQNFLPTFSIQILLENAVKHNIISDEKPLQIIVKSKESFIEVTNPIYEKWDKEKSSGTGLYNLAQR
jgi:LytS/YehU family sensor histidine kinase